MRRPHGTRRLANRKTTGFSLVELLVVIAIIGVLIALLLPAVQAAREAARRLQCANNVKQLALGVVAHEATHRFFPTGGWGEEWLGHPDRGFTRRQPGGWIYNVLPFIEQQALHDLGASGSGTTIEEANAQRLSTPLAGLNCPTRRSAILYQLYDSSYNSSIDYKFTTGSITRLARSDYAMNGGDWMQKLSTPPEDFAEGDEPSFDADPANQLSHQTGISHHRSEVKLSDIKDGASNTFLIGEKYVNRDCYANGKDRGDNETMYCSDSRNLLRWTGIKGKVGSATANNRPVQDRPVMGEGNTVQWFGSAHADTFNMSFCDGSIRTIHYSIDGEAYRRLGNRQDGFPIDGSRF